MLSRRAMIASGVAAVAGSAPLSRTVRAAEKPFLPPGLPEGVYDTATLEALPGKKPLIKLSYRPPNYETPLSHFTSEFTPNESFFVRYHLAGIPEEIDAAHWKLKVGGEGAGQQLELDLHELQSSFDAVEIAAVCELIVPGWTATYWMKHLDSIEAWTKPFAGFWMKSAYRIPTGKFPIVQHFLTQVTATNEPITEMVINSMITAPEEGHVMRAAEAVEIRGLAWDGGYGISRVEISADGGETWREAELGNDIGRFAFRGFAFLSRRLAPGRIR